MNRRQFLTSGIALTTTAVAGCTGSADTSTSSEPQKPPFEVVSHRLEETQFGNVAVVGTAVNNTDSSISYVQIEASFYSGDTRIGSGMANINDLGSGRRWEFEAMYLGMDGNRVTDYKLDVSGTF